MMSGRKANNLNAMREAKVKYLFQEKVILEKVCDMIDVNAG